MFVVHHCDHHARSSGCSVSRFEARHVIRADTPVPTRAPTRTLVTSRIHGRSRNPIYVSMFVMYVGLGVLLNIAWILVLLVPLALVIRYGVVVREETYLEGKFGDAYRAYEVTTRSAPVHQVPASPSLYQAREGAESAAAGQGAEAVCQGRDHRTLRARQRLRGAGRQICRPVRGSPSQCEWRHGERGHHDAARRRPDDAFAKPATETLYAALTPSTARLWT
jgi:hypothetical protein